MAPSSSKHMFSFVRRDLESVRKAPWMLVLIVLMLPLIYFVVWWTGGIKYVYSHSMYLPIILAGIYFGMAFGGAIGLGAAILLGPLMPIDTMTGEMQEPLNWIYRLIVFMLVGIIIGHASDRLRKDAKHIQELMSVNPETGIPNINAIKGPHACHQMARCVPVTVLVLNNTSIIDILGTDIYHALLKKIHRGLASKLEADTMIIQADSDKLWLLVSGEGLKVAGDTVSAALDRSMTVEGVPLYVDYSIGVAFSSDHQTVIGADTFKESDNAARTARKSNLPIVVGDEALALKRIEYDLLASFAQAIDTDRTYLVYQPKIDLRTGALRGVEALIRWNHPDKGMVPPDKFIPLVEETKLIHTLTDRVIEKSLQESKRLLELGHKVPVSVNISGKNLYDPDFFKRTSAIIETSGVPFSMVEFELTESAIMSNPELSKTILQSFVDSGIRIHIDDFGSGYSSLAYLTRFPIHCIKIDRYFVRHLDDDPAMRTIIRSTIDLSRDLGYEVVVEGVENQETADLLKSFGCDIAQGYHFGRPMTGDDLMGWLEGLSSTRQDST